MTIKQKQCLLQFLGYYDGVVDGVWGAKSTAATKAFQQDYGLVADGVAGNETQKTMQTAVAEWASTNTVPDTTINNTNSPTNGTTNAATGTFWDEIKYFVRAEFACPCPRCGGFPVEPQERLVRLADQVREHFGAPATVSSGVRCQAHNDELPNSAPNSYHIRGKAMDFCIQGVPGTKLLAYVKTLPVHYAYQINGSDFVRMDVS